MYLDTKELLGKIIPTTYEYLQNTGPDISFAYGMPLATEEYP